MSVNSLHKVLLKLRVLPLGQLKQPICQAEIDAAAHVAHKAGCALAHLVTQEGGDLYISAKAPTKQPPVPGWGGEAPPENYHPCAVAPPVARRVSVSGMPDRPRLFNQHPLDTSEKHPSGLQTP